jgi:hypothetical protein
VATFDGTSYAHGAVAPLILPEAGGPASVGQAGPYAMTGLGWLTDPLATTTSSNAFAVDLAGATAVRLDVARMGLVTVAPLTGTVATEHPMELRLAGTWPTRPVVRIDGQVVPVARPRQGVLTVAVPAGSHELVIG